MTDFDPFTRASEWISQHVPTLSGEPGFDGELAFSLGRLLEAAMSAERNECERIARNYAEWRLAWGALEVADAIRARGRGKP